MLLYISFLQIYGCMEEEGVEIKYKLEYGEKNYIILLSGLDQSLLLIESQCLCLPEKNKQTNNNSNNKTTYPRNGQTKFQRLEEKLMKFHTQLGIYWQLTVARKGRVHFLLWCVPWWSVHAPVNGPIPIYKQAEPCSVVHERERDGGRRKLNVG